MGTIVGTGIYIRPASIAQLLGSPALIIGVWLVGGILTLCGTLTYAQHSSFFMWTDTADSILAKLGRLDKVICVTSSASR